MSSNRVTGAQARELLAGTTEGPWQWRKREDERLGGRDYDALGNADEDALVTRDAEDYASWVDGDTHNKTLAAAAPALAETIAWLYGREPEGPRDAHWTAASTGIVAPTDGAVVVETIGTITVEEAVDFARALLDAAEKARRQAN